MNCKEKGKKNQGTNEKTNKRRVTTAKRRNSNPHGATKGKALRKLRYPIKSKKRNI